MNGAPRGNSLASRDIASLVHPYTNLKAHQTTGPLVVGRGKGVYIYDDAGKEYIEGLAGLWCTSLGFSEPRLVEAATRQMQALPTYHVFAGKSHEPGIELAERLLALAPVPMSKVFFANSGSEANDTAMKAAMVSGPSRAISASKPAISRSTKAASLSPGLPCV